MADLRMFTSTHLRAATSQTVYSASIDANLAFYRRVIEQLMQALGKDVADIGSLVGAGKCAPADMLKHLQSRKLLSNEEVAQLESYYLKRQSLPNTKPALVPSASMSGYHQTIAPLGTKSNQASIGSQIGTRLFKSDHITELPKSGSFPDSLRLAPAWKFQADGPVFLTGNQTAEIRDEKLASLQFLLAEPAYKFLIACKSLSGVRFLTSLEKAFKVGGKRASLEDLKVEAERESLPQPATELLASIMSITALQAACISAETREKTASDQSIKALEEVTSLKAKLQEMTVQLQNQSLMSRRSTEELQRRLDKLNNALALAVTGKLRCYHSDTDSELSPALFTLADCWLSVDGWKREANEAKRSVALEIERHQQTIQDTNKKLAAKNEEIVQREAILKVENQKVVQSLEQRLAVNEERLVQALEQCASVANTNATQASLISQLEATVAQNSVRLAEISKEGTKSNKAVEVLLKANNEYEQRVNANKETIERLEAALADSEKRILALQQLQPQQKDESQLTIKVPNDFESKLSGRVEPGDKSLQLDDPFYQRKAEILEDENKRLKEEIEALMRDNEVMAQAIEDVEEGIAKGEIVIRKELQDLASGDLGTELPQTEIEFNPPPPQANFDGGPFHGSQDLRSNSEEEELAEGSQEALELSELLRAASEELKNMKMKYDELKLTAEENEAVMAELRLKLDMLTQENTHLKKSFNGDLQSTLVQTFPRPDSKSHEELVRENEELVEILKKAADEIKLLRAKYAEAVKQLNDRVADDGCIDNDDFINAAEEIQQSSEHRKLDELREFNTGLWESVEQYKHEKVALEERIKRLEDWCIHQGIGQPPATDMHTIETPADQSNHSSQEELTIDQLMELLLMALDLSENVKEIALNRETSETDRLEAIVSLIDNFELFGENGKIDLQHVRSEHERTSESKELKKEVATFKKNEYLRRELEQAVVRLEDYEKHEPGVKGFDQEELKKSLELLSQEYERMQQELAQAREDIDLKDKAIKELKRSMNYIIGGDRRDKTKEVEKELVRLVAENERLRQHSLQMQRVFQQRENELLSEIEKQFVEGQHDKKK